MYYNGLRFRNLHQAHLKVGLVRFQQVHLRLHAGVEHAVGDGGDDAVDVFAHFNYTALHLTTNFHRFDTFLLHFALKFSDELGHQVGCHQLMFQATQHAVFNVNALDCLAVVAGSAVAVRGATIPAVADHDVSGTTAAAFQKAGQEVACPAPGFDFRRVALGIAMGSQNISSDGTLTPFNALPHGVINDTQMRYFFDDPCLGRVGSRLALARRRVLDEPLAIPDQATQVEFIVQNTCASLPVAGNSGERPSAFAAAFGGPRRGNSLLVQINCDAPRTFAPGVIREDALDDCRLPRIDSAVSSAECAIRAWLAIQLVAKAQTTRRFASLDPTFQTAVRLLRQMLEEEGGHGAAEPDVKLVDLALGLGHDLDPEELHSLVKGRHVFLVAAQPVKRFGHDHVDFTIHRSLLQRLKLGAQVGCPAHCLVGVNINNRPAAVGAQPLT